MITAAVFGHQWKGKITIFQVDNSELIQITNETNSKGVHMMHFIGILVSLAACFNLWFRVEHVVGHSNTIADALSCNKMSSFFLQAPTTSPEGSHIPAPFITLMAQSLTWTSKNLDRANLYLQFCRDFALSPENILCYFMVN